MYYHPLPLVRFLGCSGTTVVFTNWGKTRKNRSVFEIFLCPSFLNLFSNVGAGTVSFTVIPTSIAVNVRRKKTSPAVSNQNASFRRVTNVFTLFLFVAKLWLPKKATLLSAQQVPSCLPEGCWRTLSSSSGFLLRIQYSRTFVSHLAAVSIASIAESYNESCTRSHSSCLFRNAVSCLSASIDTPGTLCQKRNLPYDGDNRTTFAFPFVLH